MRSITKQLDMSPGAVSPVVHVSQYDSDFTIVFTLYCTDGTFTLESGTTAEIRGTKKSGTGYSATATVNISAKTVTVAGHKQMSAVAGDNIYEITLYKGSKELNSINFVLAVERAAMDQDTVVDETTIREFGELKTYIEGVKADTAASASAANASQTAAAQSATNAANSAIEAAQSAQSVDAERLNRIAFGSYVVEESTGAIVHFEDGADNIPMKDVLVHIEPVQAGSGDPSPTNVRAISGWTAAKVTRTGKNIFLPTRTSGTSKSNGVTFSYSADGTVTANGTATANAYTSSYDQVGLAFRLPPGRYMKSGANDNFDGLLVQCVDPANHSNWNTIGAAGSTSFTVTEEQSKANLIVRVRVASGKTLEDEVYKPYIAFESSGSDYEPYVGQTYSITFPSSAGTVYGGTLDVTSGVLTVDRASVDMGTRSIVTVSTGFAFNTSGNVKKVTGKQGILCDIYNPVNKALSALADYQITGGAADSSLYFKDSRFSTPEEAKAGLSGHYVCYPLETPQTYQLTPQEITSLLGTNNLWADTGDSEVEYRADTKMYVDAKVAAAVSALS